MAVTYPHIELAPAAEADTSILGRLHEWVVTVDHKRLGLMYIIAGLVFFIIGGIEAAVMRAQLAVPGANLISPQGFNRMMTMHGTTMVFLVGMPIIAGF